MAKGRVNPRNLPALYEDLSLYDEYELGNFVSDVIDVLCTAEVEGGFEDGERGFTYAEVRELLEAHYDEAYRPEDRDLERKPTQREVNFAIEVMLTEPDWNNRVIREKDGLIHMIPDDEREAVNDANHEAGYIPRKTDDDGNLRRTQSSL